ncbi:hypothetical protein Bca101_015866 [Brassica carinata]
MVLSSLSLQVSLLPVGVSQGFTGLVSLCALALRLQEHLNLFCKASTLFRRGKIELDEFDVVYVPNSCCCSSSGHASHGTRRDQRDLDAFETTSVPGNAKGAVAVVISILIFQNLVTVMGIGGYSITVLGVVAYGETKRRFRYKLFSNDNIGQKKDTLYEKPRALLVSARVCVWSVRQ